MTKHIHDEAVAKLPLSLEDADAGLINNTILGICGAHVKSAASLSTVTSETATIKPTLSRTKMVPVKGRLGKVLHKLYDLESDNPPEKSINIDLRADLYQMENY